MISVIIPALNEEKAIAATLECVYAQPGDFEVLVVDGGSDDRTRTIARRFEGVRLLRAERGRAAQMNAGAAAARGDVLLFLHADTLLPAGALLRLAEISADQAGGFHHRFSGDRWDLRLISRLHNFRCGVTGVFYGDQAMFIHRNLFVATGGFPDVDNLEDIMLSERILLHTKPLFLDEVVTTDSRKFEQMGAWRSFFRCLTILISYELRLPIIGKAFFAPVR